MSKPNRQHPYIFGRVFFPGQEAKAIPDRILFQPLGNHVGNVVKLCKLWCQDDFPTPASRDRVIEAARIHDAGKPQRFQIKSETKDKFKKYIYSFSGHRFLAKSKDKWAEKLAIGHHDFSVEDITRDTYTLKKEPDYANYLSNEPLAYARELYILEMCDQIEAELACRVLDDTKQAESRTFMDFTISSDEFNFQVDRDNSNPKIYRVDPWTFETDKPEKEIKLTFKYWSMTLSESDRQELQKCIDEGKETNLGKNLDRLVKQWWQAQKGKPQASGEENIILKPYESIERSQPWTAKEFYQQLADLKPNEMQIEMFDAIYSSNYDNDPAILLKAPTGFGKTEAILFPALASNYRLILPLPARSLLEDQKERIEKYLKKFSVLNPDREFSLVVDTGSQMRRYIYKNGEEVPIRTQNPRRHLYKGDVILTTIDKFLYRYFAFGDKNKSFIFPLRINREKTLICFDEAHSYDEISFTNFRSLVQSLYEAGRSLVLMTATMPPELAKSFDYLETIDYTDKLFRKNNRNIEWNKDVTRDADNPELFQDTFVKIILQEKNRRIIVVIERVKDAAPIYQKLKQQLGSNEDKTGQFLFVYHGRIADQIRSELYQKIKQRDDREQPYILITTSAIEVGCDLNSEILITQICPPENLIQRAGRCNRKGNIEDAKVIIIGDRIPDFANNLDESGWQNYQEVLQSFKEFNPRKIGECIKRSRHVDDYRVVELFSMLHDYVYGADLTCEHLHKRGLIPTRSWTPSVTLEWIEDKDKHSISVPIDKLCFGNQFAGVNAYELRYEKESTNYQEQTLGWGTAYSKQIIIRIVPEKEGAIFDAELENYSYDRERGFVELPKVFIKLKTKDSDVKLLYDDGKHKAIISYIKSLDTEQISNAPQFNY